MTVAAGGWIKVCGITNVEQARLVRAAGADAIGINLWPQSPRFVEPRRAHQIAAAVRGKIEIVVVTVNWDLATSKNLLFDLKPDWIQLHGDEEDGLVSSLGSRAFKALGLAEPADVGRALSVPGSIVLLDASDPIRRGGTGRAPPWELAARVCAKRAAVLAGGLTPENVQEAIATAGPAGVDVASGVESAVGQKDEAKLRSFVERARQALQNRSKEGRQSGK